MKNEKIITQEEYLKFKQEVLNNEIIQRSDLSVSALQVDSLKAISFNGVTITLSPAATKGLMKAMGVSKALIELLSKAYNDSEITKTILNHIRAAKKSAKIVTLVYNKKKNIVTAVYTSTNKVISDQQYFESLEALLARTPGAYLRNINMSEEGNLYAVLSNPNLEFQFGGKANELFTGGISFNLRPEGIFSNFFTTRLVCSNGMSVQDKLCTKFAAQNKDVPEFLQAILSKDYQLESIAAFKNRINRCYYTIASLNEVLNIEGRLKMLLHDQYEVLTDKTSINRLKNTFGDDYLLAKHNHPYLKTDITLWDLTNEVTAISSYIERNNVRIDESTNLKLQVLGGDLMFRKPDLTPSNIKQIF